MLLCQNACLNSFNISSIFSGRIIIYSAFLGFSSITYFRFTLLSAILFPVNLPVVLAALWTTFLEAIFRVSSPVSKQQKIHIL